MNKEDKNSHRDQIVNLVETFDDLTTNQKKSVVISAYQHYLSQSKKENSVNENNGELKETQDQALDQTQDQEEENKND